MDPITITAESEWNSFNGCITASTLKCHKHKYVSDIDLGNAKISSLSHLRILLDEFFENGLPNVGHIFFKRSEIDQYTLQSLFEFFGFCGSRIRHNLWPVLLRSTLTSWRQLVALVRRREACVVVMVVNSLGKCSLIGKYSQGQHNTSKFFFSINCFGISFSFRIKRLWNKSFVKQ